MADPSSRNLPDRNKQATLLDARLAPIHAAETAHGAQLAVAELDACVADHAGVEAQHLADILLGGDAGVEAHGEVVAGRVAHLEGAYGFRERELAPVLQAADHALLLEDELAGCEDDSVGRGKKKRGLVCEFLNLRLGLFRQK